MKSTRSQFDRLTLLSFFIICITIGAFQLANAGDLSKSLRIPEAGKTQVLKLNDGSTLMGRITSINDSTIMFKTDVGEMSIAIDKIKEVNEISDTSIKAGKYWFPNPNQTRLYIAPSGRMLKAKQGYFSDMYLFFPSVAYGVTNNITIAGGLSLFPGVAFDNQFFYFNPKIGFNAGENTALAASILIVKLPDFDDDDDEDEEEDDDDEETVTASTVGILFGTCTIGSEDKSLTFGLGHGYVEDDFADKPAVLLGGEYRVARRLSLVSENWIFPEVESPLISYGVRFMGESLSIDLAFFNVLNEDAIFPGIPFIGFVWNF